MPDWTWTPEASEYATAKRKLLEYYLLMNYAKSQFSINAFERVARSLFLPDSQKPHAYNDSPLPIGHGQTISAPHMAFMECDALNVRPGDKVLEIGSGSGYHASITAEMCCSSNITPPGWRPLSTQYDDAIYNQAHTERGRVITIERLPQLVSFACSNIEKAGYGDRITVIHGDGTMGYEAEAPYDKILITAAGPRIPVVLKQQLKIGGKMIIPVGAKNFHQDLILVERVSETEWTKHNIGGVVFVPLIGKYGFQS
ncbi:protein-L-isoaspartate(D-aspartate) O-methyltransferase [bacterium]|nr:protein-L-isoaspartate(D-aspartate) O-methyltransferase [bacterium]